MNVARKMVAGRRSEEGMIAVWVALMLIPVLGFLALAVDTGAYMLRGREAQRMVDQAALAGARELAHIYQSENADGNYLNITGNSRYQLTGAGIGQIDSVVTGLVPGASVEVGNWEWNGSSYGFGVTSQPPNAVRVTLNAM